MHILYIDNHPFTQIVRMKIFFFQSVASSGQDLFILSVSHSVCVSASLLTKELSLCLSWRIILNGDFLCNHLIIHQFSKKPQRVCIMLKGTAMRNRKGRGRVSRWKCPKWILALLPSTGICIQFGFNYAYLYICEMSLIFLLLIPITDWASAYSIKCIFVLSSSLCVPAVCETESISFHAFT